MGELAKRRKGIILFHDIHAVTAKALPIVLAELKAKGFKVVHLMPKTTLTTLPDYDRPVASQVVASKSPGEQIDAKTHVNTKLRLFRHAWTPAPTPLHDHD